MRMEGLTNSLRENEIKWWAYHTAMYCRLRIKQSTRPGCPNQDEKLADLINNTARASTCSLRKIDTSASRLLALSVFSFYIASFRISCKQL